MTFLLFFIENHNMLLKIQVSNKKTFFCKKKEIHE